MTVSILDGVRRIVCLGDSITEQGDGPEGYVGILRRELHPIEVISAGISGHRSNDMLERLDRDVLKHNPDLVTVSVGVNDVWHFYADGHVDGDSPRGIPLEQYRANVEQILSKLADAGAKPVVVAATMIEEDFEGQMNRRAEQYNATLQQLATNREILYIDLQTVFRTLIDDYRRLTRAQDNLFTTDGVHMNPAGYQVMGRTILAALRR